MSRRVYLASSWRNAGQPQWIQLLRRAGHEVYDFRNPASGNSGFGWTEIDGGWQSWTAEQFREALQHPLAKQGLALDFGGMKWADTLLMLQPCGRSAALELGWAIGAGKRTAVVLAEGCEPELMFGLADLVTPDMVEVLSWLRSIPRPEGGPVTPRTGTKAPAAEEAGSQDGAAFRPFAAPVATRPAEEGNAARPGVTAGETAP